MNKICARCEKVVYPIEELKCLDKSWHKACFKCAECGMTLNMKTYKGFNKLPYCAAHIPKAKATAIADTPELKRIAENTKIQSNVKYHEDFEKAKGKFTQVADDPETLRIKQNTKIISNVAYHGDLERKAAMERQREISEVSDYQGINKEESEYFSEALAAEQFLQYAAHHSKPQEQQQPQQQQQYMMSKPLSAKQDLDTQTIAPPPVRHQQPYTAAIIQSNQAAVTQQQQQQQHNTKQMQQKMHPQQIQQTSQYSTLQSARMPAANYQQPQQQQQQQFQTQRYDYSVSNMDGTNSNTYSQKMNSSMPPTHFYTSSNGNFTDNNNQMGTPSQYLPHTSITGVHDNNKHLKNNNNNNRNNFVAGNNMTYGGNDISGTGTGSSQDAKSNNLEYMMSDMHINSNGNLNRARTMQNTNSATLNKNRYAGNEQINVQNYMYPAADKKAVYNSFINDQRLNAQQPAPNQSQLYQHQKLMQTPSQNQAYYHQQQQSQINAVMPQQLQQAPTRIYRALYDYEAQDTDEVSFREGDLIYEVESIDSGWLTGHVPRTGESGMLPANYVETATI